MDTNYVNDLIDAFARGLKPDPLMDFAEWAAKYYELPPASATPGPINLELTPYIIEPLQMFSWSSPVREQYIMKGIQLAFSTVFDIILCAVPDLCPCPTATYFGSDAMADTYVKSRLEPQFATIPKIKGKISDGYSRKDNTTRRYKEFEGGTHRFLSAISEKNYREFSAAMVFLDDIDSFPSDIGGTVNKQGQGGPIGLAKNRTSARQGRYKIGGSGSPTTPQGSIIAGAYSTTDKRQYFVPCPHCGGMQVLDFFRFKYKTDALGKLDGDVTMECLHCNKLIEEHQKFEMMQLRNGAHWQATATPANPLIVGRKISSEYSLLGYTWRDMVTDYLVAEAEYKKGGSESKMLFYNTKLGETWEDEKSKVKLEDSTLDELKEKWSKVPKEGVVITCGVDVQQNRVEALVTARSSDGHIYCIEHKIIGGNTIVEYGLPGSPFTHLEQYLNSRFVNEWGYLQPILCTAIDAGWRTEQVTKFIQKMQQKGMDITAIFGSAATGTAAKRKTFVGPPKVGKYGVPQREINVDTGKTENHRRMIDGMIHFSDHPSFTNEFMKQFQAEVFDSTKQKWEKTHDHAANEAIDVLNYANVALEIFGQIEDENGNLVFSIDWEDFQRWNATGCGLGPQKGPQDFEVLDEGIKI